VQKLEIFDFHVRATPLSSSIQIQEERRQMPTGNVNRIWFPDMVDVLREQWSATRSVTKWIELTLRLDDMLQRIRADKGILPPKFRCPHCGKYERSAPTHVSVRATILSLGRFEIAPPDVVKDLERDWKRYQRTNGLNAYAKKKKN